MANLLGQNIGTNYKGILNLNTLNGNLSGTLQAVTDGDGNASPLQLSTTQVAVIGSTRNPFLAQGSRGGGLWFGDISASEGAIWSKGVTPSDSNFAFYASPTITSLNSPASNGIYFSINGSGVGRWVNDGLFIGGGAISASARLQVRGSGSESVFLAQNGVNRSVEIAASGDRILYGTGDFSMYIVNHNGNSTINGRGIQFDSNTGVNAGYSSVVINESTGFNATSGISKLLTLSGTVAAASGNAAFRPLNIAYTINNTGTTSGAVVSGIFLNATETSLTGTTHNLMNLQVDNSSKARISNVGTLNLSGNIFANGYVEIGASGAYYYSGRSYITSPSDGTLALFSNSGSTFGRLQFGGTTNAFPAIKRVGTGIELRSADDTLDGEPTFTTFNLQVRNLMFGAGALIFGYAGGTTGFRISNVGAASFGVGVTDAVASAQLEIVSTTKGFLPPRGTNTEMLAISSPATGLVFYDTTNNKLNCYDGTTWQPCW